MNTDNNTIRELDTEPIGLVQPKEHYEKELESKDLRIDDLLSMVYIQTRIHLEQAKVFTLSCINVFLTLLQNIYK